MNYHHLNIEERIVILQLSVSGVSIREIAKQLDRSPSTISRELKRNSYKTEGNDSASPYNPAIAQKRYISNKSRCGRKAITEKAVLRYIKTKIEAHWSPEQIANRLTSDVKLPSTTTIYRMIHQNRSGNILMKDLPNEDLLYMAIEQMEGINIRRLLPAIRNFLKDENKPSFAKSLLIELMIDQEIDEEMTLVKKGIEYGINPSYAPLVLNQEVGGTILNLLSEGIEDDNPSLYSLCEQFLNFYLYLVYPKYIDDYDYRPIAAAIHYHIASMQYIDIELDDIEYLYNCDKEEILEKLNEIKEIEY